MELVDTHCHIQSIGCHTGEKVTSELWTKAKGLSIDGVIDRAKENDVDRLIVVGCSLEDSRLASKVASEHANTWASIGIHPHEAGLHLADQDNLSALSQLVSSPKVVAIGECGLDYYYEHSPRSDQKKILEFQLGLARDNHLPLIFHVRQAYKDFWPIFDSYNSKDSPLRGVLHSYTDNKQNLEMAVERGLLVGVNGIATFTKNAQQLEVYRQIPSANLVLETDSPFLTPAPIRGTINEPKNVKLIAEYLAGLRGEGLGQLAKTTTSNARRLFRF